MMGTAEQITSARQKARSRAEDLAAAQIEDIRRIRAMNTLDALPIQISERDAKWLENFLQMVDSHPVHERAGLRLTAEQRAIADGLRKAHGLS